MGNNSEFYTLVERAMELSEDPGTLFLLRAAHHHESVQMYGKMPTTQEEVDALSEEEKQAWRDALKGWKSSPDKAVYQEIPCGCDDPETCEDRDEKCPPKVDYSKAWGGPQT